MLVLTRKLHESILIGNDIEVTVSEIRGNRIKLAINAPNQIPVLRSEIANNLGCLFDLAGVTHSPAPGGSLFDVTACPS